MIANFLLRPLVLAFIMMAVLFHVSAQEFKANVTVNHSQIEGTNTSVFETLQEAINSYMNETKFSKANFSAVEKLQCTLFFTISEYANNVITGDLQVQLIRPVYNSTYTTTLFNFKDSKIQFEYSEGDPLTYNELESPNNLTAILDYYAYLLLGITFDSFSPRGGDSFYERAQSVVQQRQSSGEIGWRTFEDTKNRSAVLSSYTDGNTAAIRDLLYQYHRKGLDEMVTSPDKGRSVITEQLNVIKKIYDNAPMSVALSIFRDAKLDELVNLYSKAPETERKGVYDLLQPIYPTESSRLNKIKNPDTN